MSQFNEWLAMGGYAAYVWSTYGLAFGVFLFMFLGSKWQKMRINQKLHYWFKREKNDSCQKT
jgi:heme exporter protein D